MSQEQPLTESRTCEDCGATFQIGPELYPGGPLVGQNQTKCSPCTEAAAASVFRRL